jgi:nucleotide-binding universal stress UspA family protein
MKKFIAAFDGLNFSESTMEYAIFLSKQSDAHLVGVFLEDFTRHNYSIADIARYEGENFEKHVNILNAEEKVQRDENIGVFINACQNNGLSFSVHRDKNIALQELLHEAIYADLVILCSGETLTRYEEPVPSRFIKNFLNDVQCPVLLVPPEYKPFDKIILLYDGEPSSVHAVKCFSYLFENIKELDTEFVSVKSIEESLHVPDNKLIKEFSKRHFPGAEYVVLRGVAEDVIITHLRKQKQEPVIVLGAYGRNRFSQLFKPSMADYILQHLKYPLFIAHNK